MKGVYKALCVLLLATPSFAGEPDAADIGYPNYQAALKSLKANPAFTLREDQGWIVAENSAAKVLWTFTQTGHPAHPSVIQRTVVGKEGSVDLEMRVLCEASKPACDQLIQEFTQLNQSIVDSMNSAT